MKQSEYEGVVSMLDGVGPAYEVITKVAEFIAREFTYKPDQFCITACRVKGGVWSCIPLMTRPTASKYVFQSSASSDLSSLFSGS